MKYIKNFLYIFTVVVVVGSVLCISTAIVQLGTEAIVNAIGFSLKEDWLFSISGGLGTAITGTLCAVYLKKKNYTACMEAKEPFYQSAVFQGRSFHRVCLLWQLLFRKVCTCLLKSGGEKDFF